MDMIAVSVIATTVRVCIVELEEGTNNSNNKYMRGHYAIKS